MWRVIVWKQVQRDLWSFRGSGMSRETSTTETKNLFAVSSASSQQSRMLHKSMQGTNKTKNTSSCTNRKTWLRLRLFSIEENKNYGSRSYPKYRMTQNNSTVQDNRHRILRSWARIEQTLICLSSWRNGKSKGVMSLLGRLWTSPQLIARWLGLDKDCRLAVKQSRISTFHKNKLTWTLKARASILLART